MGIVGSDVPFLTIYANYLNGFVLEGQWVTHAATAPSGSHGDVGQHYRVRIGTAAPAEHAGVIALIGAYAGSGTTPTSEGAFNAASAGAGNTYL